MLFKSQAIFPLMFILILINSLNSLSALNTTTIDSSFWPEEIWEVNITSTIDGTNQKALFIPADRGARQPLIVSLHSWSGDYSQHDSLAWFCAEKGYNYIHPDFRGPNRRPEACASKLVIQDIDDAIDYAIEHGQVDPYNIHVIGSSGGGHATLVTYMKSSHQIKSFSAYVPISNLVEWYYESLGRGRKYANDIVLCTDKAGKDLVVDEAKKRSPLFMDTPIEKRRNSKLHIYCGIHDGYTGSVPISHSLNFYNKVVQEYDPQSYDDQISRERMEILLRQRNYGLSSREEKRQGRKVHYSKRFEDKVEIIVFEGGHEMPKLDVLNHVVSKNFLAIGDSNGAASYGWVNQLKQIRFQDKIINTAVSGNTIGFDNLDNPELNTIKMLPTYLQLAIKETGHIDGIFIQLGTNDCKAVFDNRLGEISTNLDRLLQQINKASIWKGEVPPIYVISPPPYGPDAVLVSKYKGGAKRIASLIPQFEQVAKKHGAHFINTYEKLLPVFDYLSPDGVHLLPEGQKLIAHIIQKELAGLITN